MFFAVPALFKVLLIFAFILVLNRMKVHLGLALIIGAVCLAVWFGYSFTDSIGLSLSGILDYKSILLYIVIYQILLLSSLMAGTGTMQKMLDSIRSLIPSRRAVIATLPAMIGLLPMPGGAAFSAPMVEAADEDDRIEPASKAAINYWFRHVWEYWWMLYPGALLAWELSGLSRGHFMAIQMPMSLAAITFGSLFLLVPLKMGPKREKPKADFKAFFWTTFPIILVAIIAFGLEWFLKAVFNYETNKYLPMIPALATSIIWVHVVGHASWNDWLKMIKGKRAYLLILIVMGIMAFSTALRADVPMEIVSAGETGEVATEARIVDQVKDDLDQWGVPPFLVVMVIPFLSGIITGLAYGFVGTSFPIVMALVGTGASVPHTMAYVVLGYGFGYMGMMLSPVHICFLVTNEHFGVTMFQAYRKIIWPALAVLGCSSILSYLVNQMG